MPHEKNATSNIISSIQLPDGNTYEIHDASAIHSIGDLNLPTYLVFKGSVDKIDDLPSEHDTGDVYHVTEDNCEYVWIEDKNDWEPLGNVHDAAASDHVHNVSVTGSIEEQEVSVTGNVITVDAQHKNLSASISALTVTTEGTDVLSKDTNFEVTGGQITDTHLSVTNKTPLALNTSSKQDVVTGFEGDHTTTSVLGSATTFKGSGSANTSKMVTSTASVVKGEGTVTNGSEASWSAEVKNGVLSFAWSANRPTSVTLPDFEDVAVATGKLSATGAGDAVATGIDTISVEIDQANDVAAITGISAFDTASVLDNVTVTTQPAFEISSGDTGDIAVVTNVGAFSVTANASGAVSVLTSASINQPTITLDGDADEGVAYASNVAAKAQNATLTGTIAAKTITFTGTTNQPNSNITE